MTKLPRIIILEFFSLFICVSCAAQMPVTARDSVIRVIAGLDRYEEKIKEYKKLGEQSGKLDFDDVINFSNEGIKLASKNSDIETQAVLKRNIGNSMYFKGQYDKAATHFYESIGLLEKINPGTELAATYNSIAKLFRKIRQLDKASAYYNRALRLYNSLRDTAGMATICNEHGVVFEYKQDYKTADEYYSTSLALNRKLKNPVGICYALGNLSGLYMLQKNYPKAEAYAFQSLNIRKLLNDSLSVALNYGDLGTLYKAQGLSVKALSYFDSSIHIAQSLSYTELLAQNYQALGELMEADGDNKKALQYFQMNKAITDSLFNIQKAAQVEELNTKYETGKIQNQLLKQEIELRRKNYFILLVIGIFLLSFLFTFFEYRKFKLRKEKERMAAATASKIEATKAVILAEETERQRIAADLHDGVGQVLSAARMSISAFEDRQISLSSTDKKEISRISSLIDQGCTEVRNVSHQMMPLDLQGKKFDKAVKLFVSKLSGQKFTATVFSEGFDEQKEFAGQNILYRIVQECVNNVIKHAHATQLDISLIREATQITATIEDNGVGFNVENAKNKEAVGLKNISTRLTYMNGGLEINSTPGKGSCVMIYVPLVLES